MNLYVLGKMSKIVVLAAYYIVACSLWDGLLGEEWKKKKKEF